MKGMFKFIPNERDKSILVAYYKDPKCKFILYRLGNLHKSIFFNSKDKPDRNYFVHNNEGKIEYFGTKIDAANYLFWNRL
jgi:hypothetical protein